MVEIRCDAPGDKGHLLARVEDGAIAIWCVKCKTWHVVPVVDLVRSVVMDFQNGHDPEKEKRLLW